MPAFCSLCVSDDYTEESTAEDGRRFISCRNPEHGTDPWVWEPSVAPSRRSRGDGLGSELDVWDKLLGCLESGSDFVPYGVVEDRFVERYPTEARKLLHLYGHKWRDPAHPSTRYSMSVYLAARLRDLEKEGHLALKFGPAEGKWAYNGTISFWKLA